MSIYGTLPPGLLSAASGAAPGQPGIDPVSIPQMGLDPSGMAPVPEVKGKKPGFFGRIMQKPGGAQALLAFGATMLSNPDFFSGLGQGALAYQNTLDAEEERRRPKTEFLGKGAFKARIDPITGDVQMERTPLADYEEKNLQTKLETSVNIAGLRDEGQTKRNERTLEYKDRWESEDNKIRRESIATDAELRREGYAKDREIAAMESAAALERARITAASGGAAGKPPPASITKQVSEYTDVRNGLGNSIVAMEPILEAIDTGALSFGIASNLRHKAALATGVGGNEETILYSQFNQMLEQMRNALLIANKGVQTDGDADRALAELVQGGGDTASVRNNLQVVLRSLQRRQAQADQRIREINSQYEAPSARPAGPAPKAGTTKSGTRWKIVG